MKKSLNTGFSFGLTSGIITTLGLIVGLNSGTHSKLVVLGGIIVIAIADSFSDALGIHMSQESQNTSTHKEVWESTFSTFFFKLIFASTFIIPILLFELSIAIIISIVWGLLALGLLSLKIAQDQKRSSFEVIIEHLVIAIVVLILTNFIGRWVSMTFS